MENNPQLSIARRHPLIFGILTTLIFFLSINVPATLLYQFGPQFLFNNGEWVMQGTAEAFGALIGIGCVALFGYHKIWNETGSGFFKGIAIGGFFIILPVLSFLSSVYQDILYPVYENGETIAFEPFWKIAMFIITVFLIGLCEESFFRGIVANLFYDKHAKDPAGVWQAVIGTGMVFGLMHSANAIGGLDPATGAFDLQYVSAVFVQVVGTTLMGITLTAIYFRCRNIWAMAFLHGFIDFCGAFTAGIISGGSLSETIGSYGPEMFISLGIYLIPAIYVLRPSKMREIIDYRRNRDGVVVADDVPQKEKYKSSGRSVFGCAVAVIVAVVLLGTIMASVIGYNKELHYAIFEYSESKQWNGEEATFSENLGTFVADDTYDYTFTIINYPGSSEAYAVFTVYEGESEEVVYTDTFGGRCSVTFSLSLTAGEKYTVVVEYDNTAATAPMDYVTKFTVSK